MPHNDLNAIFVKHVRPHAAMACSKNHRHTLECIHYSDETAQVIDSMKMEIVELRKKLADIHSLAGQALDKKD